MEWFRLQLDYMWHLRDGRDYLYCLRPFQLLAGYPIDLSTISAKLVTALRLFCYVVHLVSSLHKIYYTRYRPEDVAYVSFVLGCAAVMVASILLILIFTWHYDAFFQLGSFLNDRSFGREHPRAGTIRERWYRWCNALILGPQCGILFILAQMWLSRQHMKKPSMFVVRGEPIGTEFDQILYTYGPYFSTVGFFMGCSIVNAMMVGLLGEMELLATCLGEVFETVERQLMDQEDAHGYRALYWTALHEQLRRCAKRHCEIFTIIPQLQRMSSFVFLQHHIFSVGLVAAGCFVTLRGNALRENTVFCEYPVSIVLEYFIFCYLVEKIQDMNRSIGDRLYETCDDAMMDLRYSREFHHEYRSAVSTIGLLITRSQHRIRFTCGSFNEVSMQKFSDFVNFSYTIVMFLLNIN